MFSFFNQKKIDKVKQCGRFNRRYFSALLCSACLLFSFPAMASWFDKLSEVLNESSGGSGSSALSNTDISAAFKEALNIGSDKVVSQLSKAGGFNDDSAIRIPLPKNFEKARSFLAQVGMSDSLDDLGVKLNRAAEDATPKAKALFVDAIKQMSFDDIRQIYNGPEDSATRYFQSKMTSTLTNAMSPVISNSLSEVGAVKRYDEIVSAYKTIPFVPDLKANLTEHVVEGGLKGIFHYLAEQEAAIRKDPIKQTTALLKKVFGS
ncbi:MAG: DUF4197 domain-containing protein [Cellvibrionaceae bacterium]